MDKRRKLIIDADVGTDDAVAIAGVILSRKFDILGVTCVHGNRGVASCARNTLRLLDFFGFTDVPVYLGCGAAMVRSLIPGRARNTWMQTVRITEPDGREIGIHDEVIEELPPTAREPERKHACAFLLDALRGAPEPIDILAIGPLTNIAMALRLDPSITDNIGAIYVMGGALATGNRTPVAEANFYDDPEAAEIVLQCGAKVVVCPLEPSLGGIFDAEHFARYQKNGNRAADFVALLIQNWLKRLQQLGIAAKDSTGVGVCDWFAAAALIDLGCVCDLRNEPVRVDISGGAADGMMVFDRRPYGAAPGNVHVIYRFDLGRTADLFDSLLRGSWI